MRISIRLMQAILAGCIGLSLSRGDAPMAVALMVSYLLASIASLASSWSQQTN